MNEPLTLDSITEAFRKFGEAAKQEALSGATAWYLSTPTHVRIPIEHNRKLFMQACRRLLPNRGRGSNRKLRINRERRLNRIINSGRFTVRTSGGG